MVRFQPDGWLETLMRPIIMMDPAGGIYFEGMAPDWRFGMFLGLVAVATVIKRRSVKLAFASRQLILGLCATLYLWVWVIGNGRYYMAGLILIGPLVVVIWRSLPGTLPLRYTLLTGLVLLQCMAFAPSYKPNQWGLAEWIDGAAVELEPSTLRDQPAVFITSTAISYSILIPKFHPESRWANVVGQRDILPGMREYQPLVEVLKGPLPKMAVLPMPARPDVGDNQPTEQIRGVYGDLVKPFGLSLAETACTPLRSRIAPGPTAQQTPAGHIRGFWICPLEYSDALRQTESIRPVAPREVTEAFRKIEQRCPRFFPEGNSNDRLSEGLIVRQYGSDMRLLADSAGNLSFRYFRALNPSAIGTLQQVNRGEFEIPCDKPPGRYVPPWVSH